MSDAEKPLPEPKVSMDRAAPSIDLAKADVKDMTPKTEPATPADVSKPDNTGETRSAEPLSPAARSGSSLPVIGGAVAGAVFGLLGVTIQQNLQAPAVTVADPRVAQVEAAIAAVDKKALEAVQLEQRLTAQIKALEARATAAEQKAAAADQRANAAEQKAGASIAPLDERLKASETRLTEAAEQSAALAKRVELLAKIEPPKPDLSPISGRLDALEKSLGSTSARVVLGGEASQALDGRIKQAEQAISDLKTRKPADTATSVLAAVGMARRAFDGGELLGPHVTALAGLGVSEGDLKPLAAYAATPAPRPQQLADQLSGLAGTFPKPKPPVVKSEGFLDRLRTSLLSQVEVKATGSAAPDISGQVLRARGKLSGGDLAGALGELSGLPQEQRDILKPLLDAVAARQAAVDVLRRLETDALAAAARKS